MRLPLAFLIFCLALVGSWTAYRLSTNPALFSPSEVGPALTLCAVIVAWFTWTKNGERSASGDYLDSAKDLLEKAHAALDVRDEEGRPQNKRMHWLTAARLICTAEEVASKIREESHKRIWEEHVSYWRGRFYDLINPGIEGFPSEYYAERPEHMYAYTAEDREPLSERSLAVLYRFAKWPEGRPDPMRGIPAFTEAEIDTMQMFGPRGLGNLLERVRQMRGAQQNEG